MKLKIEAQPGELKQKTSELVKAVGDILESVDPELAERLEKAVHRKESELKFPVLRGIQKREEAEYNRQMDLMTNRIMKVVEKGIKKSDSNADLEKGNHEPETKKPVSPDYTEDIVEKEEERYENVKQNLIDRGYVESDFEEGGPLYGMSTNQLIDMIRDKKGD